MTERIKQAIRIYLRPEALRLASIKSAQTGKNMSETIEQLIKEAHFADDTNNNNNNAGMVQIFDLNIDSNGIQTWYSISNNDQDINFIGDNNSLLGISLKLSASNRSNNTLSYKVIAILTILYKYIA